MYKRQDIGRLDAGGLYYLCTPVSEAEARPGDLVFFEHTFEGPWITPVSYTHLDVYKRQSLGIRSSGSAATAMSLLESTSASIA